MLKRVAKKILNQTTRTALRRFYYYGRRFSCSVCGSKLRAMHQSGYAFPILTELQVVGGEVWPNDTCPVCFSHNRTRLIWEYLRREVGVGTALSAGRVLHFAPEYGLSSRLVAMPGVDYRPVDIEPQRYSHTRGTTFCDATVTGFASGFFDLVICNHVLEHIPDDQAALREIRRILRPGGIAILQVPLSTMGSTIEDPSVTDRFERERRFGQHDHVRIYGSDYPGRLKEAGFVVEIFDPAERWGRDVVERLRLNPRERVFVGRAPVGSQSNL